MKNKNQGFPKVALSQDVINISRLYGKTPSDGIKNMALRLIYLEQMEDQYLNLLQGNQEMERRIQEQQQPPQKAPSPGNYELCQTCGYFMAWGRQGDRDAAIARKAREDVQPFIDLVNQIEGKQREMNEIMRKTGLKIDNLGDPIQKLAFTFYSEIAEMAAKAEATIKEYEESLRQQQGRQEQTR